MLKWKKAGKTVGENGSTCIEYQAEGKNNLYQIKSRSGPTLHPRKPGYWMMSKDYVLVIEGLPELSYPELRKAKAAAEVFEAEKNGR